MRARTSVSPTDTPRCVDPQLDRKEKARSRGPFTRNEHKRNPAGAGFQKSCYAVRPRRDNYIGSTASACRPFWPWTTVNVTFWPSFRLLKPWDWIARKCTNTSSPFSRLMKPKPLASLNHLTVPVSRLDIVVTPWNGWNAAGAAESWLQGEAGCNDVVEPGSTASGHDSGDPWRTQPGHGSGL